jgi:hypothetical protein
MQRTYALLRSRCLWAFLVVIGLLAHGRAEAQPAQAQVAAGDSLMAQGQYRAAAGQYEAAYAIDPALPILERMAEAYRMSGDQAHANVLYQRIAAERAGYPPPQQPYIAPTPLPSQPMYTMQPRPPLPPGQAMLNMGIGFLVGGYGAALVGGAISEGVFYYANVPSYWYGAAGMLFIPIAGPFATLAYTREPAWAVPWAVIDGGMQLAGLGLIIAGAVIRSNHRHHPARRASLPFDLAPYGGPNGSGLMLSGRF